VQASLKDARERQQHEGAPCFLPISSSAGTIASAGADEAPVVGLGDTTSRRSRVGFWAVIEAPPR
jgi:hypothetical protein